MKRSRHPPLGFLLLASVFCTVALLTACTKSTTAAAAPSKHEHHPPHGGTPVVLGTEIYHVEFVLDATAGKLSAYVLDGELEQFIRAGSPGFEVTAKVAGKEETLAFQPVANAATGETLADTSLYESQADWLKTAKVFDAVLKTITVRGQTFANIAFNFPKGNDTD